MGKIALCLYGQPRFINNPVAYESYKTHIIDRYSTDVFAHYWFDPSLKTYEHSDFSRAPGGCSANYTSLVYPDTEQRIIDLYHPKAYKFEAPKDFPVPGEGRMLPGIKNYPSYRDKNLVNLKSQLYSWQKTLEVFEENRENEAYDWVVITRFDLNLLECSDLNVLPKGRIHAPATLDIAVIDPNYCKYLKPFDRFDDILSGVKEFDAARWKTAEMHQVCENVEIHGPEMIDVSLIRTESEQKWVK